MAVKIVILPARNEADEAAGNMLAHLLALDCIGAEVLSSKMLVQEMLGTVSEHRPALVFISAFRTFAFMHATYNSKRLRAQDGIAVLAHEPQRRVAPRLDLRVQRRRILRFLDLDGFVSHRRPCY